MSEIKVDKEKCIGCGLCVSLCPEVFQLGEDGKAEVKNPQRGCDIEEAAESCPVGAIKMARV